VAIFYYHYLFIRVRNIIFQRQKPATIKRTSDTRAFFFNTFRNSNVSLAESRVVFSAPGKVRVDKIRKQTNTDSEYVSNVFKHSIYRTIVYLYNDISLRTFHSAIFRSLGKPKTRYTCDRETSKTVRLVCLKPSRFSYEIRRDDFKTYYRVVRFY